MPATQHRITNEEFQQRLDGLRSKIEQIPEQHRPALRAAADKVHQQHDRIRLACAEIDDLMSNLGLIIEHVKFHVSACRRELREQNPDTEIWF